MCFEMESMAHPHIEPLAQTRLVFIGMSSVFINGQTAHPLAACTLARAFGFATVTDGVTRVTSIDELDDYVEKEVIPRHGKEGDVLYMLAPNGQVVDLLKVKTAWYVIARAIREKVKALVSDTARDSATPPRFVIDSTGKLTLAGASKNKKGRGSAVNVQLAAGQALSDTTEHRQVQKVMLQSGREASVILDKVNGEGVKLYSVDSITLLHARAEMTKKAVIKRLDDMVSTKQLAFRDAQHLQRYKAIGERLVDYIVSLSEAGDNCQCVIDDYPATWQASVSKSGLDDGWAA